MRIYFLCADDKVFLPRFFEKIFSGSSFEIAGVAIVADPNFKKFLKASLRFMGWRIFSGEVYNQLLLRMKNLYYRIFAPSRISAIENVCNQHDIECRKIEKVNSRDFRDFLSDKEIDVLVSVACPQILKSKILQIPRKAAINIHYGLLPNYRGQYPSFWVLANGEQYTGVSVHFMTRKVDAGDILVQVKEKIKPDDTFYSLVARLKTTIGPEALLQALKKIDAGDLSAIPNVIEQGSYFSFPSRKDMRIFLQRGRRWR
jgi:methionyl-tRNA formyltransferase